MIHGRQIGMTQFRRASADLKALAPQDTAYRGYLIRHTLSGELTISKDGFHIGYARNLEHAKQIIDEVAE